MNLNFNLFGHQVGIVQLTEARYRVTVEGDRKAPLTRRWFKELKEARQFASTADAFDFLSVGTGQFVNTIFDEWKCKDIEQYTLTEFEKTIETYVLVEKVKL